MAEVELNPPTLRTPVAMFWRWFLQAVGMAVLGGASAGAATPVGQGGRSTRPDYCEPDEETAYVPLAELETMAVLETRLNDSS